MSVIVSIFMGLTVSAEEIIKDRKILKREAFLNLSWNSYLMSKVSVQFVISAIQALTFVIVGNSITEIRGMWFEYWLVLFSCWAASNMLGLVISDSFKAVVTIYILIPFLVIPQIILSGVMVKFEKLNPNIPLQSPVEIPFYGEGIVARWGYEALAVEQFIYNKYERLFYQNEKDMSKYNFIKQYWKDNMNERLATIESNLSNPNKYNGFTEDLDFLQHEIKKQLAVRPDNTYNDADKLTPELVTPEVIQATKTYVENTRVFYMKEYNRIDKEKNNLIFNEEAKDKKAFTKLKDNYYNDKLAEFATNKSEIDRSVVYKNRLYQKIEPIFMDPQYNFIKAHFYSPTKLVFGISVNTFIVNVLVIWTMTGLLYLALYFRVLKKLLDFGELLGGKKGSD
jgi:hypothetical protein